MQRFMRSSSVVSRVIAGETLIVPVRKGVGDLASIYSLNEIGSAIWNALEQPRTPSELVQQVRDGFEAGSEPVDHHVNEFLAQMQSAGLVDSVGEAA